MASRTFFLVQFFCYISSVYCFPFPLFRLRHSETRDLSAVGSELASLGADLKNSSTLKTFLGDRGNVITQNDVLDSNGSCATMTVLFARGTGEVGMLTSLPD